VSLNSTEIKKIRKFGLIALLFFGFLSGVAIWRDKTVPIYFFATLALLGAGFLLIPATLRPIYRGWMRIAHFIGRMITTFVLTLAYFLAITPVALIKRVFGKSPLPIRPDENASSYWVERTEAIQPNDRYIKRY
jgi:drug/metabolite transporter (DMT)-like permease